MCDRFIGRRAPLARFALCYDAPPLWGGIPPPVAVIVRESNLRGSGLSPACQKRG